MPLIDEPFSFNYFGHTIVARSVGPSIMPSISKLVTAHVIPFDSDSNVVAVNITNRGWDIPGGHIDEGELSPLTTLRREADEEAQITVATPILIDILDLKSETLSYLTAKPYMVLYAARIDTIREFTPNDEVSARQTMEPDRFIENYFGYKPYAAQMMKAAMNALSIR